MRGPVETPFTFSLGRTVRWEKAMPLQNESTRRAVLRSADKRTCSPRVLWNCKIGWDALPSPLFEPRRQEEEKKTLTKEFIQSDFPSLPLLLIGGDGREATQFEKHAHSDPHSGVTCSTFVIASSLSLSKRGTFFQWDFLSAFLHRTPQIQPRSLICRLCKFVCEFYNCVRRVFHRRHAPDD